MLTFVENGYPEGREALRDLFASSGRAHIVGVTGPTGSGKSTLIGALAREYRKRGRSLGIVAVDPTSPFSHGAILGDRIRMQDLTSDPGVFIRSMATRGALGGLAPATNDVVTVLDAAGYDLVLVETVGSIEKSVDGLLEIAGRVGANTANIPQLEATAPVLALIVDEAVVQDGYMNALTDGFGGR